MLPPLTPPSEYTAVVLRTDFGDEAAWRAVKAACSELWGEAAVHFVDDPAWTGATPEAVIAAASADEDLCVVFLADHLTMRDPEHTLLAVAVLTRDECDSDEEFEEHGGSVRTVPARLHDIHANLSIANLDFGDVRAAVGTDGVLRSF
ncbi:DUF6924 domain-containing protein [Kitasatospora sp. NPDC051853]|uniref:DUF6924 domain-containing protein n=1 Tax=Kitasatospora sp. NPDC051853 TaxID=3364058 RepID=UPI0037996B61